MADTTVSKTDSKTVVAPVANGATPAAAPAPAPEKRKTAPREVPLIGVSAKKSEYDEVKAALVKTMSGLEMEVPLGPFLLACALKHIRTNIK